MILCECVRVVYMCVCVRIVLLMTLKTTKNEILWWEKWKNEIRARTLRGMILTWKKVLKDIYLLILLCQPQIPQRLARGPASTRGIAGMAGRLLTQAAEVGCGMADRQIVFQFPAGGIHSHAQQSVHNCLLLGPTNIVLNRWRGSFRAAGEMWSHYAFQSSGEVI
jgi:hypothetical protein